MHGSHNMQGETSSPESYLCFEIRTPPEAADGMSAVLHELGCLGIRERESRHDWHAEAYFPSRASRVSLKQEITDAFDRIAASLSLARPLRIRSRTVLAHDWETAWRESLEPFSVTDRIVVRPTICEHRPKPGEIVITMDPRMAFGSGHHETTRMAIECLQQMVRPGCSVLDAGAGTGILAIAAAGLGAGRVVAVEIDPVAYENLVENIRLNRLDGRIETVLASLADVPHEAVDIMVANIDRDTLMTEMDGIAVRLAEGGGAILTGMLAGEEGEVEEVMRAAGLKVVSHYLMGDWALLVGRKKGGFRAQTP